MKGMLVLIAATASVALAILNDTSGAYADQPIPQKLQSVMLVKVMGYVKEFGGKPKNDVVSIGVLGEGDILELIKKAADASETAIRVRKVELSDLAGIDVLFLPLGTSVEAVREAKTAAVEAKILTSGGDPQHVIDHRITLSFQLENRKPRILINPASGQEEGATFSPKLLKISDLK